MTLKAEAEARLDAALGHRVGDGLFNRDYPARASVGKRSGVSQRVYRTSGARATRDGVRPGGAPLAPLAIDHRLQSLRLSQAYK